MKKEFTCIVCPMSCSLTVYQEGDNIIVEGNSCNRGKVFGENEFINPKRMLTTTVKVEEGYVKRLPVISSDEIPKNKMFECVKKLYKISVKPPIEIGQVIMENICDTGVNIVASRSIKS
jgi:CxxC motif-containing protein